MCLMLVILTEISLTVRHIDAVLYVYYRVQHSNILIINQID